MNQFTSNIDHSLLQKGLWLQGISFIGPVKIYHYDLRLKTPWLVNCGEDTSVNPSVLHSIEHLLSSYFYSQTPKENYLSVSINGSLTGIEFVTFLPPELFKSKLLEAIDYSTHLFLEPNVSDTTDGNISLHSFDIAKISLGSIQKIVEQQVNYNPPLNS